MTNWLNCVSYYLWKSSEIQKGHRHKDDQIYDRKRLQIAKYPMIKKFLNKYYINIMLLIQALSIIYEAFNTGENIQDKLNKENQRVKLDK